jgi:hypothetical protein
MVLSISSTALSYGGSKLFQIIAPLTAYIFFRELPFRQPVLRWIARRWKPDADAKQEEKLIRGYDDFFDRALGFMSWKVGCDLGFFLVATGVGDWPRAFTWAGLIPYTVVQYLVYYFVGQKMIIEGHLNPFRPRYQPKQLYGRPPRWKQIVSKYFHENLNETSYNVPLRQVILKPFVDYGGIVSSWSIYTVGLLCLQSGEINFAPVAHFFFLKMIAFYLVNVFGFILGFNLGEIIYYKSLELVEYAEGWIRGVSNTSSQQYPDLLAAVAEQLHAIQDRWVKFKTVSLWRVQPFLDRYNLNFRWFICSAMGVFFVVLLEPSFASTVFSISDGIQHWWFDVSASLSDVAVQQVVDGSRSMTSDYQSDELLVKFPELWNQLFFSALET